jgi:nitrite reductase/ring-hydroxylating ferredoxin subunit
MRRPLLRLPPRPRDEKPSLGSGELTGKVVRCRGHGWKYDVTTGFANGIDGFGVATYPVKVVDGNNLVAVG